jgi:hypothetical protein
MSATLGASTSAGAGASTGAPASSGDSAVARIDDGTSEPSPADPFAYVAGVRHPYPETYVINMAVDPHPYSETVNDSWCPRNGPIGKDPDPVPVPDLADRTADQAVAALAKLGRYCLIVMEKTDCTAPSGDLHVCEQRPAPGETVSPAYTVTLYVQSDIIDRGTDHETRRVPELDGRRRDDVLADLARRGFTNVQVVDEDAGCEPDTVCYPDVREGSFMGAGEAIVLHIRKRRGSH